jgi:peptidoglycan/xylan/chitin deacetylase (PgdA/CDA1 family)
MSGSVLLRRLAKSTAAVGLHALRADRLIGALSGRGREVLVMCYHQVVEDVGQYPGSAPAMLVSTATLERQLDWVGRRFQFVGLDELAHALEYGRRFRGPVAAVTFDDGYADVYRHAFPLLARKGIPAAIFVVTGLVGGRQLQIHDELYLLLRAAAEQGGTVALGVRLRHLGVAPGLVAELDRQPASLGVLALKERLLETWQRTAVRRLIAELRQDFGAPPVAPELLPMSWEMVAEMHAAGHVVGSHTRTHRVLPNESEPEIRSELEESRRELERRLGAPVAHVAYPDGQYCKLCLTAAHAAGYRYGYTTCYHRSSEHPLLTIPRRTFWERSAAGLRAGFSPAVAACQVHGVFDRLHPRRCDHSPRAGLGALRFHPGALTS